MDRAYIRGVLTDIMTTKFSIDNSLLVEENFDIMLTGKTLCFDYIMMLYLLLEIEVTFDVCIEKDSLKGYRFSTINKIVDLIYELKHQMV